MAATKNPEQRYGLSKLSALARAQDLFKGLYGKVDKAAYISLAADLCLSLGTIRRERAMEFINDYDAVIRKTEMTARQKLWMRVENIRSLGRAVVGKDNSLPEEDVGRIDLISCPKWTKRASELCLEVRKGGQAAGLSTWHLTLNVMRVLTSDNKHKEALSLLSGEKLNAFPRAARWEVLFQRAKSLKALGGQDEELSRVLGELEKSPRADKRLPKIIHTSYHNIFK